MTSDTLSNSKMANLAARKISYEFDKRPESQLMLEIISLAIKDLVTVIKSEDGNGKVRKTRPYRQSAICHNLFQLKYASCCYLRCKP